MTFTEKVKSEILKKQLNSPCCRLSALSAFIRGAGTISVKGNKIGFEIITENKDTSTYFYNILLEDFGQEGLINKFNDKLSDKPKYQLSLINDSSLNILMELCIVNIDNGNLSINLAIDKYLVEEKCCKKAYVIGAFLGGGSCTIPQIQKRTSSGYHLEFVFSKYQTALDFSGVLSEEGFLPKLTKRKENYVVYFKGCDEICELLSYLGATKSMFDVENVIIEKGLRNETNRRINCEMANIEKQVNAAQNQINAIEAIK